MRTVVRGVVVVVLSGVLAACSDTSIPGCEVGPVETSSGDVCGFSVEAAGRTVSAFLGIPYAESTAGENRWRPPVPEPRAGGATQAVAFGDICPQTDLGSSAPAALPPQSEDCLSVNVWTPAGARPGSDLPVFAFIHGGAFLFGSSANPVFDGAYLAASQDLVLVTLNYRLGAFGFLAGIDGLAGNYGFQDQQLALRWIGENAEAFGGDPRRVTIFGESAGAMSVGLHMLSAPSSAGLFVAGAMESNPFGLPYATTAQQGVKSARLAKAVGCEGAGALECLRAVPAAEIVAAEVSPEVILPDPRSLFQTLLPWVPVVDGEVIVAQPVAQAAGGALEKPVLLGTNRNEGTSFVVAAQALGILPSPVTNPAYSTTLALFFGAANVAAIEERYPPMVNDNAGQLSQIVTDYLFACASRFVVATARDSAYAYEFDKVSSFNSTGVPECADEVCHAAELPYVFYTAENIGHTFTPAEDALSNHMVGYWGSFAHPGHDPNRFGPAVAWPGFLPRGDYLILDTPITTEVLPPHHCDLWDAIGYDAVDLSRLQ